ncbi:hypothetical protein [Vandammella animalimorsus]|uniref:hypothetical protein n=1 Tax=Vandammella animalimorsus TaxID=2029117 RepID=UPI0011773719|nr:hypothetical protein [Vandammella animalimorsus]
MAKPLQNGDTRMHRPAAGAGGVEIGCCGSVFGQKAASAAFSPFTCDFFIENRFANQISTPPHERTGTGVAGYYMFFEYFCL